MQSEGENSVEKTINSINDCVNHVLGNFSNSKVAEEILASEDILTSTIEAHKRDMSHTKEILKEFLRVKESESQALEEIYSETLGSGITQQLSQITQTNRKKNVLEEEAQTLRNKISHTEHLQQQLDERSRVASQNTVTALPEIKVTNQMFAMLSRLKWDHAVPENVVKGFVIHPQKKDITPFKINKESNSQYFISNFLWQQIGADCEF